jgi:hypothetical protein
MLTQLLREREDVAEALARLVVYESSVAAPPLQAFPHTDHYSLIGTAFDYLLRWELERRNPSAKDREWVATTTVTKLIPTLRRGSGLGGGLADRYQYVHREALRFHRGYLRLKGPLPESIRRSAARLVLCLAKIDPLYRAGKVDPTVDEYDPADVDDVLALLEIVPWESLGCRSNCVPILNPDFGSVTVRFKGADADLVIEDGGLGGGILVDFKASKYNEIAKHLPQLVGYGMIIDLYREENPFFPEIAEAGIYWARHGALETFDFGKVRSSDGYDSTRTLLLQAADELFGEVKEAW